MEGNKWISRPKFGLPAPTADAVRLFCFTPAGAGPTTYTQNGWSNLPASVELAPVILPGRGQRFCEPVLKSVAEMAAAVFEGLRPILAGRPYALYGHSLGSLVAFEFARLVAAAGAPAPVHIFLAAKGAPLTLDPATHLSTISDDMAFVKAVQEKYQSESMQMVIDSPDLMEMVMPMMRGDFSAAELYTVPAAEPVPYPTSAIGGDKDQYTEANFVAWEQFIKPGESPYSSQHRAGLGQIALSPPPLCCSAANLAGFGLAGCWRGVTMLENEGHMFVNNPPPLLCELLTSTLEGSS
jgi:surfactin synthase thioesterase subunit